MKSALIILVLIGMTACMDEIQEDHEAVSCYYDPSMCSNLQCCRHNLAGYFCISLSGENEECFDDYDAEMIKKRSFIECPCMKGLTCVQNNDDAVDDAFKRISRPYYYRVSTCQRHKNGSRTDLTENHHGMQNERKPILPSDKEEKENYFDLEKNIKKENIEVESAGIENLQLEKSGKKKCRNGRKPSVFPSRI